MTTILETALKFWELGISTVPCYPHSKLPMHRWSRWQNELPPLQNLLTWFGRGQNNLAVVTGQNGLAVLDFDNKATYDLWIEFARFSWPAGFDLTYRVFTARGVHVYFRLDNMVRKHHIDGLGDLQAAGGYVIGAESIHPTGAIYTAQDGPIVAATLEEILPPLTEFAPPVAHAPRPTVAPALYTLGAGDAIERAKSRVRLETYFPYAKKTGDGWLIDWCPFHNDYRPGGTPSLWIDTARQICGCFSGCNGGRVMDGINVYARLNDLTNGEAIRELARGV